MLIQDSDIPVSVPGHPDPGSIFNCQSLSSGRGSVLNRSLHLFGCNVVVNNRCCKDHDADDEERKSLNSLCEVSEDDSHYGEVRIGKCAVCEVQGAHDRHAQCREEGDQDAVQEGSEYTTLDAAFSVSVYTGYSAAEEVRNNTGKDQSYRCDRSVEYREQDQTDDTAYEGYQEADQNCVGSVREYYGAVDCGYCAGNQFLSNTSECGNDLADDQADAAEDYIHAAMPVTIRKNRTMVIPMETVVSRRNVSLWGKLMSSVELSLSLANSFATVPLNQ